MHSDEHLGASEKSSQSADWGPLARLVRSTFFIPLDEDQLFSALTGVIARVSEPYVAIGQAFRTNIVGLLSTISMPYTLASASTMDMNWQRLFLAARIRARGLDAAPHETEEALELRRDREALARVGPNMDNFLGSPQGREAMIRGTLNFLEKLRSNASLVPAANEFILQGLVLCWGGFEVLARDSFIQHLNLNPARSLALHADSVAKRRFEMSRVSLETLASHNFDLSTRMGTLLAQQQDLSDVYSVKAAYQALFPGNEQLHDALNDPNLRLLSLRRNLIVHQRGVIDETYSAATRCAEHVGDRLTVQPDEVEAHLRTAVRAATAVIDSAARVPPVGAS